MSTNSGQIQIQIQIHISCEPQNRDLSEFIRDWGEMREKLRTHEITQEEYDEWKTTWDNGVNVMDLRARGEL